MALEDDWGANDTTISPPSDAWGSNDQEIKPEEPGFWSSKAGRFLYGAAEPAVGLTQLASHATGIGTSAADKLAQKLESSYQRSRTAAGIKPEDWDYWAGAGNVLSPITAIPGLGELGVAEKLIGPAKGLLGLAAKGAVSGATYGAAQPITGEDYWGEKAKQVGTGAIAGGVASPAVGLIGKVVKPEIDEAAKKLLGEGVELTPGQIMGGNMKRFEDVAAKTPLVGGFVRGAQEKSLGSFNTAVAKNVLNPLGKDALEGIDKINPGHDLVGYVNDKISQKYDELLPKINLTMNKELSDELGEAGRSAYQEMVPEKAAQFRNIIKKYIVDEFAKPENYKGEAPQMKYNPKFEWYEPVPGSTDTRKSVLPGDKVQSILSELKRLSRDAHASDKLDDKMTAGALDDIVKVMQDHIGEQNPNLADQLSQVNKSYARFTRLVDAASSTAAKEGVFSPTQLTQSVRRLERNKGKSAKGQAMMQDLAEAGKKVIAPSISDSGTVERGLTGAILGGLHLPTTALMTGAAIPALYSSWGQKAARAALTKRPAGAQAVSDILKRYAPLVGGGLGATGFGGSQ